MLLFKCFLFGFVGLRCRLSIIQAPEAMCLCRKHCRSPVLTLHSHEVLLYNHHKDLRNHLRKANTHSKTKTETFQIRLYRLFLSQTRPLKSDSRRRSVRLIAPSICPRHPQRRCGEVEKTERSFAILPLPPSLGGQGQNDKACKLGLTVFWLLGCSYVYVIVIGIFSYFSPLSFFGCGL